MQGRAKLSTKSSRDLKKLKDKSLLLSGWRKRELVGAIRSWVKAKKENKPTINLEYYIKSLLEEKALEDKKKR